MENYNRHNKTKYLIHPKSKDFKMEYDFPLGYNSYSENDISDKISNNNSYYEEKTYKQNEIISNLKHNKPFLNDLISGSDFIKFDDERKSKKNNNNLQKAFNNKNKNNFNYNQYMKKVSNDNFNGKILNKSNDKHINNYQTKKIISNKHDKFNPILNKFPNNKDNKKTKEYALNDNKNTRYKHKHLKYKSLKSVIDNSDVLDENVEHKEDLNNSKTFDNNKLYFNNYNYIGDGNKIINYDYFILNSNNHKANQNLLKDNFIMNKRRTSLYKEAIPYVNFHHVNNDLTKYQNSNIPKDNRNKQFYICLRNSLDDKDNNFLYDNYLNNSNDYYDNNTLNQRFRFSQSIIENIYNPKVINIPKLNNPNTKKFSKTFIDIKDIMDAKIKKLEQIENNNEKENKMRNNLSSNIMKTEFSKSKNGENSQQKSYQKKLLNNNNNMVMKKKKNSIIGNDISDLNSNNKFRKKDMILKNILEKNKKNKEYQHGESTRNQLELNSKSNNKALSPLATNINNNLINTEKISHNKLGNIRNYRDEINIKKKIFFSNSNNNTITNSKVIKRKTNNIIIPIGQNNKNKILFLKEKLENNKNKNAIDKKQMMIYKKRKISNQKYQSKIKKKHSNTNSNLNLNNFFTDSKQSKNDYFNMTDKNIRKVDLFKSLSTEKNRNEFHIKNKNNSERNLFFKMNPKSDNINLKYDIKKNNKSKIYIKAILKKWKMNAKIINAPLAPLKLKVINDNCSIKKKFYNFYINKNQTKICFLSKRYKVKIPINKLCVYSKNIILKDSKNEKKENIKSSIKNENNNNNSFKEKIIEENDKKADENSNNSNNIIKSFEDDEENENEDFKIEEYEEKHLNSIMNMKNTHSIANSNSAININNIIIEENIANNKNIMTLGKEIQSNSEVGSLMNSKTSIPSKEKRFIKIEAGLEKLCRIFFRNLENKNREALMEERKKKIKKEKSDSNINSKKKSKYSALFSSTIQNWNDIDKKYYENEETSSELEKLLNKKDKKNKNKKHVRLINVNKSYSEEKIKEQHDAFRRSVDYNSNILLEKNNKSKNKNKNKSKIKNKQNFEQINPINEAPIKSDTNLNINAVNFQKQKFTELLNILSVKNYSSICDKILNLIKNNDEKESTEKICFEVLLNNQFEFVEVIVDKAIKEEPYMNLYSTLCKDLYLKLMPNFICNNKKKEQGENLKSILASECKQKFDECDILSILKLEKNKIIEKEKLFEDIQDKLIGIVDFLYEIINTKMISQKMGLEYLGILHKRIVNLENEIKNNKDQNYLKKYKDLFLQAEVILLEKISKIIIERKKPKHVQNFKNFIEDNIIPMVSNNNSENQISNYLKCKIINLLDKLRKIKPFNDIKEIKLETKDTNNKNTIINIEINKDTNKEKNIDIDNKINKNTNKIIDIKEVKKENKNKILDNDSENIISLKKEIEDYMAFLSKHKIEKSIKKINEINDEFSWSVVDDLINKKNIPLETIINYYIKICIDIIKDKSVIFKANEYIKAVINYYSYNFSDEKINSMQSKMIELFLDIDNICINNSNLYEIMGFLLFLLMNNEYKYKFFYIKNLNIFSNKDINTQINIAKVVKFTIIYNENDWKKCYNIFKKTNLFSDGNVFNNYITNPLKLEGFKI